MPLTPAALDLILRKTVQADMPPGFTITDASAFGVSRKLIHHEDGALIATIYRGDRADATCLHPASIAFDPVTLPHAESLMRRVWLATLRTRCDSMHRALEALAELAKADAV